MPADEVQKRLGALLDPPDDRDYLASMYLAAPAVVPDYVDLPLPPVGYQGALGACVGWAHAYQHSPSEKFVRSNRLSPLHIYTEAKKRDGNPHVEGTYPRAAYKGQAEVGACEEYLWPYEAHYPPHGSPQPHYLENAALHRIKVYAEVAINPEAIMGALAMGKPVAISIPVHTNFFNLRSDGVVQPPTGNLEGHHRMVLRGYERRRQLFKAQNSWSDRWGLDGCCWFPFGLIHTYFLDCDVITDMPTVETHWIDWPDTNPVEQDILWHSSDPPGQGIMRGYDDGTFRPWEKVTRRACALVAARLGSAVDPAQYADDYTPVTRGEAKGMLAGLGLTWDPTKADTDPLTRFQLGLQTARKLSS